MLVFVLALMLFIPVLAAQLFDFIERIPGYVTRLQELIAGIDPGWLRETVGFDPASIRDNLGGLVSQGASFLSGLFTGIWNSGRTLIDLAGLFVVTPVVAFYMLLDWDRMVAKVDSWVPRDHVYTVRRLALEIDRSVAGFVRGQGHAVLTRTFMPSRITLVGELRLLIGLLPGLSFIPYIGSLVGLVLSVASRLSSSGRTGMDRRGHRHFPRRQFVEGNILQPKLVGRSVGLHPSGSCSRCFASCASLVGLLIAVPAAARRRVGRFASSATWSPRCTGARGRAGQPRCGDLRDRSHRSRVSSAGARPSRLRRRGILSGRATRRHSP